MKKAQRITRGYIDELTYAVIGAAIEVHKELGAGLLESLYHQCLAHEFELRDIPFTTERRFPIHYKEMQVKADLRYDFLVDGLLVVELKSVSVLHPVHYAQLKTYMKLMQRPKGVLINFNCVNIFNDGQKTIVNEYYSELPL